MSDELTHIRSRDGKLVGAVTGEVQPCDMEGCRSDNLQVEWPDGDLTWVCPRGLTQDPDGVWRIA